MTLALLLVLVADALPQVSETFNSSGTFVVPSGVTEVTVECWGGGGRGGTRSSNGRGGGGGGGAYSRSVLSVSPGSYTVTVGAGSNSTAAGGDSWFSTAATVMAKGGSSVANNSTSGAVGGSAAAGIGDVKFSGGNGANAPGGTGGGGGSSAGTAANGGNGSGQTGGTAPAGGANGGNGGNGTFGTGANGAGPGGGGGGAERGCCFTINGGSGGNGQVVVTYVAPPYVNGTCMTANGGNAIPDNGCGSSSRNLDIVFSGLPTTLGTAPGNARLLSVEVIVSHTYNSDLEISLTSPGSTTRSLIADRFGSGDNLGNPAACPGSPLVFADGGTALNNTNTSDVTGTYAPEETLAGFTGNPNGTWTLSVCDDAGVDIGNVLYVRLNFCTVPLITSTNSDSPVCAGDPLNLSVTASGTAPLTYAWTGAGAFSPDAASPTPVVTGPATGNYNITVSNSCGSTNTDVAVIVNTPSTYYQDLDTDGFGDPSVSTMSCVPVAGYVANNTDNCPSVFGLIGDACDDSDANTINDQINGSCVCAGTNAPWYSQGSGTFADAIWSQNIAGPGAAASLNSGSDVIIQAGHAVTISGAQDVHDLSVEATASLGLGANTMTVHGNSVDIDGVLNGGSGNLSLQPSGAATLDGSGTLNLFDLTVDAPSGLNCLANAPIRGTLLLVDGVFTATGNVSLVSNVNVTGRLGPVAATASYVGNLTVNRRIPGGATNWRMLGSSVSGQTIDNLKDDFYTAGFPGSHYPNFYSPVNSTNLWPSIRWYDETNTGAAVIDGLVGATSNTQAMATGQGFAAWSGDNFSTTAAFMVDMTGTPNVANSPIALPMSYTNTGAPAADGWNMVSNPLPSPIAFDQISRGSDVEDFITYFDPATGNNATWDISLGIGLNNGTNTVQSSQGFWLKATGSNVTTTVSESAKVAGNTGGFFGGDQEQINNMIRLQLTSNMNQYSDETVVIFSEGSPEINGDDVPKFIFAHPEAPQIASVGDAGELIAINAYGEYSNDISIPVTVDVAVNGMYTITATGLNMVGLSCLQLEDLATSTITPLVEGVGYSFTAMASDDMDNARFVLHASAPLQLASTAATCAGRDDGVASVNVSSGPVDIIWMDSDGAVMLEQNGVQAGISEIQALEAGAYSIHVTSNAGCGDLVTNFFIDEPAALEVEADASPTSCPSTEDGTIELMVLGGTAPFTYAWSNGSTESNIEVPAGTYTVEVTDANGCIITPQEYVVSPGEGPEAGISVESTTVMVNDEVTFFVLNTNGVMNSWDFGDGETSTELEPTHSYALPGEYTITLVVDDADCTNTTTLELIVESTTGLPTVVGHSLNAWVSGDVIVVDHNFNDNEPVLVRIIGTNGQLVQTHRFAGQPARLTLPTAELATGIWLVRVSSGSNVRTFSLPVLH